MFRVLFAILLGLFGTLVPFAQESPVTYNVPSAQEFNGYVIAMMQSYPTDGTHQYYWPSGSGWSGNTRDLYYRGSLFLQGDTYHRCYCCGLTFEVFFRSYEKYCKDKGWEFIIQNFDKSGLSKFKSQWFGSDGNRKTLQNALVANGLGKAIAINDAKKGDFVQFWRFSGSGHSVIFVEWIYNNSQQRIGMRYWSTQNSTNGVGYNAEYFSGTAGIDTNQIYIARVGN